MVFIRVSLIHTNLAVSKLISVIVLVSLNQRVMLIHLISLS